MRLHAEANGDNHYCVGVVCVWVAGKTVGLALPKGKKDREMRVILSSWTFFGERVSFTNNANKPACHSFSFRIYLSFAPLTSE